MSGDRLHTRRAESGRSVIELLAALAVASTVGVLSLPGGREVAAEARAEAAARHLAAVMRELRTEAARRSAVVALDFDGDVGDVTLRCIVDGNANGVRRTEIAAGVDVETCRRRRLGDDFPGVRFGTVHPVPDVDGLSTIAPGERGLRFGASNLWSVSPTGTATSGTAYVSAAPSHHYAVRVLGATGRVRVLRYDSGRDRWAPP